MYRGSDKKTSPAGSYRLPTPERVPEGMRSRAEETRDGRSQAGGSEHSEEPQTETRGALSNISSEVVAMSTGGIYTSERMRCHAPEWTPPFRHPGTSQERRKDTKDRRR